MKRSAAETRPILAGITLTLELFRSMKRDLLLVSEEGLSSRVLVFYAGEYVDCWTPVCPIIRCRKYD